jgi:hypothetical protein
VLEVDLGAHRLQPLDVLVDRPQPDRAAAGQRHARLAAARDQRAQREDRRAHRLDQLVWRQRPIDPAGVEDNRPRVRLVEPHPHLREQRLHRADVVEARHVGERQRFGCQQRGAEDRQRGVLRTRHADLAAEPLSPFEHQLVHGRPPVSAARRPTAPASAW